MGEVHGQPAAREVVRQHRVGTRAVALLERENRAAVFYILASAWTGLAKRRTEAETKADVAAASQYDDAQTRGSSWRCADSWCRHDTRGSKIIMAHISSYLLRSHKFCSVSHKKSRRPVSPTGRAAAAAPARAGLRTFFRATLSLTAARVAASDSAGRSVATRSVEAGRGERGVETLGRRRRDPDASRTAIVPMCRVRSCARRRVSPRRRPARIAVPRPPPRPRERGGTYENSTLICPCRVPSRLCRASARPLPCRSPSQSMVKWFLSCLSSSSESW